MSYGHHLHKQPPSNPHFFSWNVDLWGLSFIIETFDLMANRSFYCNSLSTCRRRQTKFDFSAVVKNFFYLNEKRLRKTCRPYVDPFAYFRINSRHSPIRFQHIKPQNLRIGFALWTVLADSCWLRKGPYWKPRFLGMRAIEITYYSFWISAQDSFPSSMFTFIALKCSSNA